MKKKTTRHPSRIDSKGFDQLKEDKLKHTTFAQPALSDMTLIQQLQESL